MKHIFQKLFRYFAAAPTFVLPDASWEVEYLVQKFCKQYQVYPEQKVRQAVAEVFSNTLVPVPGEVLVGEIRKRLEEM